MLRISEIKGKFLSEMITDCIQLRVVDSPFSRPRLNPLLMSTLLPFRKYSIELGVMKRENGINITPTIKTRSNTCTTLPFRRRNQ